MRYRSLDGLRGVAAGAVVIHHFLLVLPAVAAVYMVHALPERWSPAWWLTRTPVQALISGNGAVMVFFVLSGFVLTLMFNSPLTARFLGGYYARRLLRLYLPVWASLLLATGLALIVPRDSGAASSWIAGHPDASLRLFLHDAFLLGGASKLNSPLWSLTWEIWFSLLVPLMVILLRRARVQSWWCGAIPLLVAISAVTNIPGVFDFAQGFARLSGLGKYLPIFAIGMVVSLARDDIVDFVAKLRWHPLLLVVALLVSALPALVGPGVPAIAGSVVFAISLFGVTGVVVLALSWPRMATALESPPLQWLGSRSFSLYLVHEPLIVSSALLMTSWSPLRSVGWVLVVLVSTLVLTEIFYRLVEHPAHRLSNRAGRVIRSNRLTVPRSDPIAP